MSKKDKNIKVDNGKFVQQLMKIPPEELYNKFAHGKKGLKGNSKSETRLIKAACPHHYITKKGKRRSLVDCQNNRIYCRACRHSWDGQLMSQDKIDSVCNAYIEILNMGKYFTTAMDFGAQAQKYFITASLAACDTSKIFGRLTELVSKDGAKKRSGKKNGKKKDNATAIPGTWKCSK